MNKLEFMEKAPSYYAVAIADALVREIDSTLEQMDIERLVRPDPNSDLEFRIIEYRYP